MTKERFRELAKRLHPDKSGTNKTVSAMQNVLSQWRVQIKRRYNHCRKCGATVNRDAVHCGTHRMKLKPKLIGAGLLLFTFTLLAQPGVIKLAWEPSPDAVTNTIGYHLYASTNSLSVTNLDVALVKIDAGTNLTATISNAMSATWHFMATAYDGYNLESTNTSNEVIVLLPRPPKNMMTVTLEWNATVTGTDWMDAGYFRVRLGP